MQEADVASGKVYVGHHPNIVSYQKVFEDDNTISMVYEVCDHELTEQLMATPVVSEAAVAQLCKPMLLALDHCHSNGKGDARVCAYVENCQGN